ncbi:hypothetical protein CMI48_00500 [Candidatus Pacearchaeota archaeon]|nr:hypothetical protein [Candidatus Pacearchaeota archaeon]|tara:strand:+ start:675 stop:1190 length:516 start_codon:yes stop_codon:yes gene_type:complete
MVNWSEVLKSWKTVFGRPGYIVLAVAVALVFYVLNVVLVNWGNLGVVTESAGFVRALWLLSLGFSGVVSGSTFWTVVILGVLTGVLVSLLVAKTRIMQASGKKDGVLAGIGLFLGLFVPGCAACGVGLLAALGLGGVLLALPFQGTEIAVVAILVGYVVVRVSEGFGSCKI